MTADAFSEDIQGCERRRNERTYGKTLDKAILWREIGKYLNSDFSQKQPANPA